MSVVDYHSTSALLPSRVASSLTEAWFQGIPDPILLCDRSQVVFAANRAACQILGASTNELLHQKVDKVLTSAVTVSSSELILPAAAGPQCREFRGGSGRTFDISRVALSDYGTGVEGWAVFLHSKRDALPFPEFIGRSGVAQELLQLVSRLAASRATAILVIGESGTGKELIAKRLHALSARASAPFVPINCAALPETLLETELFGHEKGAFTGAQHPKEGLLEVANGGTVLLDEVSELPVALQAKLLRVLEDHSFRRVGGNRNISVDIRVIAATNADLQKAIEERRFRSDLYYRLNGVQIQVPPLRERLEDLREMTEFFIDYFNHVHDRRIRGVHPVAKLLLERHSWPGNVRELRNAIERAVLIETSPLITKASLAIQSSVDGPTPIAEDTGTRHLAARYCLHDGERELILAALAESGGNQSRAAALLGIGRFGLRYKMKKLGMLRARETPLPAAGRALAQSSLDLRTPNSLLGALARLAPRC